MSYLIGLGVVIVIGALIIFPQGRTLLKGVVGLFITDLAKTPKGAEAVYTEAINEAQDSYNNANTSLQKITGQLVTAQNKLKEANDKLTKCEKNCETWAKQGDAEKVGLFAEERQNVLEQITSYQAQIEKFTPMQKECEDICVKYEKALKKLQSEKQTVIAELEANIQAKQMYDEMDELKHTKPSSKLLDDVKKGLEDSRSTAIGAKTVYENKTSTKILHAENDALKLQNDDYVKQLMEKYKK